MVQQIAIGCPLWHREWLIERWWCYVEAACMAADVEPRYAFLIDQRDTEDLRLVNKLALHYGRTMDCVIVDEKQDREDERVWNARRYEHMVWVRNQLLDLVRRIGADYFLSLDSDILLHQEALRSLLENIDGFDAMGGRCYMTSHGNIAPSYALHAGWGGLLRPDETNVLPVDVIMGIKLMRPSAYNINYEFHPYGEDIGWSINCTSKGLKLGWDGTYLSKHVVERWMLEQVDPRVGW